MLTVKHRHSGLRMRDEYWENVTDWVTSLSLVAVPSSNAMYMPNDRAGLLNPRLPKWVHARALDVENWVAGLWV